jgi:hypothetical protein
MKLLSILPQYVRYLRAQRESMLTKYLGAHALQIYGKKIYFVIMANIFHQVRQAKRSPAPPRPARRSCVQHQFLRCAPLAAPGCRPILSATGVSLLVLPLPGVN